MLKDQIKKLNDELYKLKNPSTDLKYTTNRNIFNVMISEISKISNILQGASKYDDIQ